MRIYWEQLTQWRAWLAWIVEAWGEMPLFRPVLEQPPEIRSLAADDFGLNVTFRHPAVADMARLWVEYFEDMGGRNFVQAKFWHPRRGAFEVTVQRLSGKTPAELIGELEREIAALRAGAPGEAIPFRPCDSAAVRDALHGLKYVLTWARNAAARNAVWLGDVRDGGVDCVAWHTAADAALEQMHQALRVLPRTAAPAPEG